MDKKQIAAAQPGLAWQKRPLPITVIPHKTQFPNAASGWKIHACNLEQAEELVFDIVHFVCYSMLLCEHVQASRLHLCETFGKDDIGQCRHNQNVKHSV